ncbi:unnamed protein product [Eruca vesicaria subsp. sativa]|uniref:Uncharacterized protein n=1 Tax=Eruca vesicaria subsp. sativa TaxID=29727 RepID=A0ABC8KPW0_ERUVS|nr:unnamed protein product [Eruca vesicaria subsp. sativa]
MERSVSPKGKDQSISPDRRVIDSSPIRGKEDGSDYEGSPRKNGNESYKLTHLLHSIKQTQHLSAQTTLLITIPTNKNKIAILGTQEIISENADDSSTTKPNIKRNSSGELDVFEATRYFSDFNEPTMAENSRIQIQKQSTVTELRQKRVHPETETKLPEPRVVIVKPHEKEMKTRGGGGKKLTSFLNSLLRSAGLKKLKSKSTLEVESPRVERRRRHSCVVTVTTHAEEASSPISGAGALNLHSRRRSFDENEIYVKGLGSKFNMRLCESLCSDKKVECKDRKGGEVDVNGGYESDSGSDESDLFELDLFAKLNP